MKPAGDAIPAELPLAGHEPAGAPAASRTRPELAAGTSPSAVSKGELDRSLVNGVLWTGAVKWGGQGLSWAATLIVARLLTPQDYGLVGMATVFFGLITLLTEFGIGAAVVTLRDLSEHQIRQLNGLAVMLGIVGFLVSLAAALPLSWFFDSPQLVAVVCVLSTTFLITAFKSIPNALLQRGLRFRQAAGIEGLHMLVMSVAWVGLAALGLRYWTLVAGAILGSLVSTLLAVRAAPTGFAWPQRATLGPALALSRHLVVSRLCWYGYANADFVVAGRMLGKSALGAYSFAWNIASMPVEKVTTLVGRVAPGVMSAAQHDVAELRRYLVRITHGLAMLTVPAAVGLALISEDFVAVVLGPEWTDAIAPLRILALYAAFRSLTPLLPTVLMVVGESAHAMRVNVLALAVLPVAFFIGSRWGGEGIALAWVLVHPLVTIPLYRRLFDRLQMRWTEYAAALVTPACSSALMATAVLLLQAVPGFTALSGTVRLVLMVACGVVAYAAAVLLLFPADAKRLRRVVLPARFRQAQAQRA